MLLLANTWRAHPISTTHRTGAQRSRNLKITRHGGWQSGGPLSGQPLAHLPVTAHDSVAI